MKRRDFLVGAPAGLMAARALSAHEVPLVALPGKGPLLERAFRPPNFETPLAALAPDFTPNSLFFVRYHLAVIPAIDPRTWRLSVGGASAAHALSLSLEDLRENFTQSEVIAVNQCSGNRRGLFEPRVPGVQWGTGAMGNARWRGVRLREVLERAGIVSDALEVWVRGADRPVLEATPPFQKSLPLARALDDSTLIAFEMNGAPLPHWNGAPARLVVPGWTGTYWMKHLTEVRLEPKALDNFWMKAAYRLPVAGFPGGGFPSQSNAETRPITDILVNSLITSPAPEARLARGRPASVRGKAWDGGAGIAAVEVSVDGGAAWHAAHLGTELGRYAWRSFEYPLDTSKAGPLAVRVRARSRDGSVQPDGLIFNASGYHDNRVQQLALEIA